jgi:hypothetical protein
LYIFYASGARFPMPPVAIRRPLEGGHALGAFATFNRRGVHLRAAHAVWKAFYFIHIQ